MSKTFISSDPNRVLKPHVLSVVDRSVLPEQEIETAGVSYLGGIALFDPIRANGRLEQDDYAIVARQLIGFSAEQITHHTKYSMQRISQTVNTFHRAFRIDLGKDSAFDEMLDPKKGIMVLTRTATTPALLDPLESSIAKGIARGETNQHIAFVGNRLLSEVTKTVPNVQAAFDNDNRRVIALGAVFMGLTNKFPEMFHDRYEVISHYRNQPHAPYLGVLPVFAPPKNP